MTRRIMFVISDLEGGGAQRVAVTLLERWARDGWEVHAVTIASGETDFFELPSGVTRSVLDRPNERSGLQALLLNNRDRILGIYREIQAHNPDVVVSFMDTVNVLSALAVLRSRTPV